MCVPAAASAVGTQLPLGRGRPDATWATDRALVGADGQHGRASTPPRVTQRHATGALHTSGAHRAKTHIVCLLTNKRHGSLAVSARPVGLLFQAFHCALSHPHSVQRYNYTLFFTVYPISPESSLFSSFSS